MTALLRTTLIAASLATAAGCSSPPPSPAARVTQPAPLRAQDLPIASNAVFLAQQPYATVEPGPDLKAPQFCHVSVDCMELDSRPFAPCYTSGKPCEGQGVFMYVAPAEEIKSVVIGPRPAAPLTNYPAFTTTAPR